MLYTIPDAALNGGVFNIETRAEAELQNIPPVVMFVSTGGYTDIGDNGGALYKRVGAEPTHLGKFQSANGAWFEIIPANNDFLNVKQFGAIGDGVADDTASMQSCMDFTYYNGLNCYVPSGDYLVTGLIIPGDVQPGQDDRSISWKFFGDGFGEPFSFPAIAGTRITSVTDATVLEDITPTGPQSNGTIEICKLRIAGNTTVDPIVSLKRFYGLSSFHHNTIYQAGNGDGLFMSYGATFNVNDNYIFNSDYLTFPLGNARTGVGLVFNPTYEAALGRFYKNTCRGFLTGFEIGDPTNNIRAYALLISENECSYTYNGFVLHYLSKCKVKGNYLEGADQGTGILVNTSTYMTIEDNLIFAGYSVGIDDTDTTVNGNLIQGNLIGLGAVVGAIAIDVTSSSVSPGGAQPKTVTYNSITQTMNTNFQIGIRMNGDASKISVQNNSFDPKAIWGGASSYRIQDNTTTEGNQGFAELEFEQNIIPVVMRGAISLAAGSLTGANVNAGVLELASKPGNFYSMNAAGAVGINSLDTGERSGQLVIIETVNANATFNNTALIDLDAASGAFTGPGTITFMTYNIGATTYAKELCRSVF